MTTSPLVALFKEQLENESSAIADGLGLLKRGDFLIWWYFQKLVGLSETEIGEVVCDGSGDLGIDAIIIDSDNYVHFYQFKNPESAEKIMEAGEIDKMLSGLQLILSRNYSQIANDELIGRIEEIYQSVPSGYRIHIVTSGDGLPEESAIKLNSFIEGLRGPSEDFIIWEIENIKYLQDRFYRKTLPTIEDQIVFDIDRGVPYQVRSADHDCYVFHTTGNKIADLYEKYGEQLLQQNIRVYQGDKSTNASIRETCIGAESANFFHFNNGITFLCETAGWDQFTSKVSISKAQIVNGGQTARVIYQAHRNSSLKDDVLVPIRVITSQGDKEFASNVAVNLNNQNKVESSFLRSNHPHIIQLSNSLSTLGWYLERREGEVKSLTDSERQLIEHKIGNSIEDNAIKLKEGAQAFAATFYRQPELAKKNPKLLFLSRSDGGHFERLFSAELTAEKFLYASKFKNVADVYVKNFGALKRRKSRVDNWEEEYRQFFPDDFFEEYSGIIDQVIPQSSVFLTAVIFERYIRIRGKDIDELLIEFESVPQEIILDTLSLILRFAKNNPDIANKSWPTLLKSQSFFSHVCSYIKGLEEQNAEQSH
jgi:hypothetical protein